MDRKTIAGFRGAYRFLSNFEPCRVDFEGITFPTVEHAFQAAKTLDRAERARIAAMASPGEAKRAGRHVKLRQDWEEAKQHIMLDLLRTKFAPGTELAGKLLATGDSALVEANTWHDNYWGSCNCLRCGSQGKNMLGISLMAVRDELLAEKE